MTLGQIVWQIIISVSAIVFAIWIWRKPHLRDSEKIYWVCSIILLCAVDTSINVTWDYPPSNALAIIMVTSALALLFYLLPLKIPREGERFSWLRGAIRSILRPKYMKYENDPEKRKMIIGCSSKILGAFSLIQIVIEDSKFNCVIVINLIAALLLSLLHDLYSYKLEKEKDRSEPGKLTIYDDSRNQSMPRLCRRRVRRTRRSYNRF